MTRSQLFWSLAAWCLVGIGWFVLTRSFHPTTELAIVVTASLMLAYAAAAYANELWLLPAYRTKARRWAYWSLLITTMVVLTGLALAVIRLSYFEALGPDPDPNGAYKHFAIDVFGMAVHVGVFASVMRLVRGKR